ncbi:hypothetical protein [Streptomyces sp. TRM68416]|uniref:hypothetical protein n=1 Tax=Streptomyces sp. TRM68416 TaxID=2758412 RepID=UPI002948C43D|nr:hypothetical protein [Streptomyces sp. TRM68416]
MRQTDSRIAGSGARIEATPRTSALIMTTPPTGTPAQAAPRTGTGTPAGGAGLRPCRVNVPLGAIPPRPRRSSRVRLVPPPLCPRRPRRHGPRPLLRNPSPGPLDAFAPLAPVGAEHGTALALAPAFAPDGSRPPARFAALQLPHPGPEFGAAGGCSCMVVAGPGEVEA